MSIHPREVECAAFMALRRNLFLASDLCIISSVESTSLE